MNTDNTVAPIGADGLPNEAADLRNIINAAAAAWRSLLEAAQPELTPNEARFLSLLLTAEGAAAVYERTVDVLIEECNADPALQKLLDDLTAAHIAQEELRQAATAEVRRGR